MMNRFKKGISILCIIALLVSCIVAAFAEDAASDNNEATVVEQQPEQGTEQQDADDEAARQAEEAARKAAEEEAARKAAEEEAARKAAEEEAARKAAEETAAKKAAEEAAAKKAAEEEAAKKAAEEEAARKAAEEVAAQQTEGADEEAAAQQTEGVDEEAAAKQADESDDGDEASDADDAEEGSDDEYNNEGTDENGEPEYEIFEDGDEGFVTPEKIAQEVPAVTQEIIDNSALEDDSEEQEPAEETGSEQEAVPEAKGLMAGKKVSGTVVAGEDFLICLFADSTETIVLSLTMKAGETLNASINEKSVKFTAVENDDPTSTDAIYTYELSAVAGQVYDIVLSADTNTSFKMKAEAVKPEAETEDTEEAEDTDGEEESSEVGTTEGETSNINEETTDEAETADGTAEVTDGTEDTEGNETADGTEETEGTEEAATTPIHGWITVDAEEIAAGTQVTLKANADADLTDAYIVWQTKAADADDEAWEKIGYSESMVLDVTEENINNEFRFKIADDTYSDTFRLVAAEAVEEEGTEEETVEEEIVEETSEEENSENVEGETTEDVESEVNTDETEEAEGTDADAELIAQGWRKVIVNEEGADVFESTEEEAEAIDHLEARAEIFVKPIDETWAILYTEITAEIEENEEIEETIETVESSTKYIKMNDVTLKTEEVAEDTEEAEETEETDISDETQDTTKEFLMPEGAKITFEIYWDGEALIGETAHFRALVAGLDDYDYTLQWQQSADDENWENIEGATGETMDLVATEEANKLFYRAIAIIHVPQPETTPQDEIAEQEYEMVQETESVQDEPATQD